MTRKKEGAPHIWETIRSRNRVSLKVKNVTSGWPESKRYSVVRTKKEVLGGHMK